MHVHTYVNVSKVCWRANWNAYQFVCSMTEPVPVYNFKKNIETAQRDIISSVTCAPVQPLCKRLEMSARGYKDGKCKRPTLTMSNNQSDF